MKYALLTLLAFISGITNTNDVFGAIKRNTSRSSTAISFSGSYSSASNTYNLINSSSETLSNETGACGIPASKTDAITKRECTLAYANALKEFCKTENCNSKIKVELELNFSLSMLNNINATINNQTCKGKELDATCMNFSTEIIDNLWDLYSEKNIRQRKSCNIAKARYSTAQDCFVYIQTEKNSSVGSVFNKDKITELDKGIERVCGADALEKKYQTISIDDITDADKEQLVKNSSGNKLSSDIATQFSNIGDNSWNITGQIGKLADLNFNTKSSTYPRELVVLSNTFVTEGETSCGSNFTADMEDTSFELIDNRSSLEKEIAKTGLLKGSSTFIINSLEPIIGQDAASELKDGGIVGFISSKTMDKEAKENPYENADDLEKLKSLSTTCSDEDNNTENITFEIQAILSKLSSFIETTNPTINDDEKSLEVKNKRFDYNKENIKKTLNEILKFTRDPQTKLILGSTKDNFVKIITELMNSKFTCPGRKNFEETEPSDIITYSFEYETPETDIIEKILNTLEASFSEIQNINSSEYKNEKDIQPIIEPIINLKE